MVVRQQDTRALHGSLPSVWVIDRTSSYRRRPRPVEVLLRGRRRRSPAAGSGTRTSIRVPPDGRESIAISPPTRQQPLPHADQTEPPLAVEPTRRRTRSRRRRSAGRPRPSSPLSSTRACRAPLCLMTLLQGLLGDAVEAQGRVAGDRRRHRLGGEFDRQAGAWASSLHRPRTAATSPSCSSFDGCRTVDRSCTAEDSLLDPVRQLLHPLAEAGHRTRAASGRGGPVPRPGGPGPGSGRRAARGRSAALRLLGLEQPAGQGPQFALALPQVPPPPLAFGDVDDRRQDEGLRRRSGSGSARSPPGTRSRPCAVRNSSRPGTHGAARRRRRETVAMGVECRSRNRSRHRGIPRLSRSSPPACSRTGPPPAGWPGRSAPSCARHDHPARGGRRPPAESLVRPPPIRPFHQQADDQQRLDDARGRRRRGSATCRGPRSSAPGRGRCSRSAGAPRGSPHRRSCRQSNT